MDNELHRVLRTLPTLDASLVDRIHPLFRMSKEKSPRFSFRPAPLVPRSHPHLRTILLAPTSGATVREKNTAFRKCSVLSVRHFRTGIPSSQTSFFQKGS